MRFTLLVAWRYIFSKKSTNAINIISGITMLGITIGSAALILVLSAFNGFGGLVLGLYSSFYADITITPATGKTFLASENLLQTIEQIEGVDRIAQTLEENAMLVYNDQEHIATIKGVDTIFSYVTAVDDSVFAGEFQLQYGRTNHYVDAAVLGSGVAATLQVALGPDYPAIQVFMPRRGSRGGLDPRNAFIQQPVQPLGVFRVQADFDSRYMITNLNFIRQLLEYNNSEVSALEISLVKGTNPTTILSQLQETLGPEFVVKDRRMQNDFIYKVMRNERWVVYLILTFILVIATFNMIGSISMLVIDKRKDIETLRALGANSQMVRQVFFLQGVLQTLFSIAIGFGLATVLCLLQIWFGLVSIPGSGSFVVSTYPVELRASDYLFVGITILTIGSLAAWFPASMAGRQKGYFRES